MCACWLNILPMTVFTLVYYQHPTVNLFFTCGRGIFPPPTQMIQHVVSLTNDFVSQNNTFSFLFPSSKKRSEVGTHIRPLLHRYFITYFVFIFSVAHQQPEWIQILFNNFDLSLVMLEWLCLTLTLTLTNKIHLNIVLPYLSSRFKVKKKKKCF